MSHKPAGRHARVVVFASITTLFLFLFFSDAPSSETDAPGAVAAGVRLTIDRGGTTEHRVARMLALYVRAEDGPVIATFDGQINLRIRGTYSFIAHGRGSVTLIVNDEQVLEASGEDLSAHASEPVGLARGANHLRMVYKSPAEGSASIRLLWSERDRIPEPIAPSLLRYEGSDEHERVRHGRELFASLRCIKCHTDELGETSMPELSADAPDLTDIDVRLTAQWMAKWIENPRHLRADATMPRVVQSKEDAIHIAAYLVGSQNSGSAPTGDRAQGAHLFTGLGCIACHTTDGRGDAHARMSLAHVGEKFRPGALVEYLKQPEKHFAWTKMPNFNLSDEESRDLAAFLIRESPSAPAQGDPGKGKALLVSSGCLNCHTMSGHETTLQYPKLSQLQDWSRGCASANYQISAEQIDGLRAFASSDLASLHRDNPVDFAQRQIAQLNCLACHARDATQDTWSQLGDEIRALLAEYPVEGEEHHFSGDQSRPPLTWTGEKLRPDWMERLFEGEISYKARPWLHARMPAFASRAKGIAHGLAMEHGCPPVAQPHPTPDPELAQIGRRLSGKDGGFSCVQCHAVKDQPALAAFEAPAPNFMYTAERLNRDYYDRWMLMPQRVQPGTRMPDFADADARTALRDFFDGDARRQFDAIWQYLLLGPTIEPP